MVRLADHFGLSRAKFKKRHTKKGTEEEDGTRPTVLRHQDDPYFGSSCALFDMEKRRCSVYQARPDICREYPGRPRCG